MRDLLSGMMPAAAFWLKGRDTQPSDTSFVHSSSPAFGSRFSAVLSLIQELIYDLHMSKRYNNPPSVTTE